MRRRPRLATAAWALIVTCGTARAETCRFAGTTSYGGTLAATAVVTPTGPARLRVDVAVALDATPLPLFHTHYLTEEISDYDADGLSLVAVNDRYAVDGRIVRQNWDVFRRAPPGLAAYRVEGKTAARFGREHPGFADLWPLDRFARPWVERFDRLPTERRPDLDLDRFDGAVRPPLALAFWWAARLPRAGDTISVFLPGFKDRKRVDLAIRPTAPDASGDRAFVAPLRYPALDASRPSSAQAVFRGDALVRLDMALHGTERSAVGHVVALGCVPR